MGTTVNISLLVFNTVNVTPTQLFSCEFYEMFRNTYFVEHVIIVLLLELDRCCFLRQYSSICFVKMKAKFQLGGSHLT